MSTHDRGLESALSRHQAAPDAVRPLSRLLRLLSQPSAPTSVRDPEQAMNVHIADSLAGLQVAELRTARVIADLGAGAGIPGLVLAAVLTDSHVVLVEAAARKCAFLRLAIGAMELRNAEVVRSRAEDWGDGVGRCDVVCARAVASLPVLCEYAAPLLRERGILVAWKGAVPEPEIADGVAAAAHLGLEVEPVRSVVPFGGSERRTLHVVRKVAPTPSQYPRRAGIAAKRPLSARTLR